MRLLLSSSSAAAAAASLLSLLLINAFSSVCPRECLSVMYKYPCSVPRQNNSFVVNMYIPFWSYAFSKTVISKWVLCLFSVQKTYTDIILVVCLGMFL